MASSYGFSLDYVLQMLTSTLVPEEKGDSGNQIVFLLGAGCSRQYGLPNFRELLTYIWDDCFEIPAESLGGFQALRDELDRYWQAQGPKARRQILRRHLSLNESLCPGYHRLAMLAREGHVKAIVNMNFDDLLERELVRVLRESRIKFRISTSFRAGTEPDNGYLMVYKPHGTIGKFVALDRLDRLVEMADILMRISLLSEQFERNELLKELGPQLWSLSRDVWWVPKDIIDAAMTLVRACVDLWLKLEKSDQDTREPLSRMAQAVRRIVEGRKSPLWARNDLILDIANSDLFANPEEQIAAQDLLTSHDVVSIGYSGVDAKIAAALRSFKQGKDPRDKKLYFVNLEPPDPRILLVLAERASQHLCVSGEDAAFESFMERFQVVLKRRKSPKKPKEKQPLSRAEYTAPGFLHLMSRGERVALAECLRLALSIRAAINVGDRSAVSIEEHGNELYGQCVRLADIAGLCLTSPEKYLLHCAAFLHDLGYFSAYSGGNAITGLQLLRKHGKVTADLLRQRFSDDPDLAGRIIPTSYEGPGRAVFVEMLLNLCQYHPAYELPSDLDVYSEVDVEVVGVKVPVRLHRLHSLFSVAEHIVREHPFRPSSDPVIDREGSVPPIDDPILDLYLRRKESEIAFELKRKRIEGCITLKMKGRPGSKRALWLLSMARMFSARLSEKFAGWPLDFCCEEPLMDPAPEGEDRYIFKDLLKEALEEELQRSLSYVRRRGQIDVAGILDQAGQVLERIVPKDGGPGLLSEVPENLARDLRLLLSRTRLWIVAVSKEVRENWIADMGANLQLAELLLKSLKERLGRAAPEALTLAGDSVEKAVHYFEDNKDNASARIEPSTLEAARKVVGLVAEKAASAPKVREALEELSRLLSQFGSYVEQCSIGEVISTFDLLAIYALPVADDALPCKEGAAENLAEEPRVALDRDPVKLALERVRTASLPHQGLLHLYFSFKRQWPDRGAESAPPMERAFVQCYEKIMHPAWRFFARNWHDHSEPLLMARVCLDMGSSAFRPEVAGGVKYLLGEKVEYDIKDGKVAGACGHEGCTMCTSRLLYVLSCAKRLFSGEDLERLSHNAKQRGVDEAVAGLLRYFRARDPGEQSWWGLGAEKDEDRGVYSADYLAWAARAVTFCRSVDEEIEARTGRSWLQEIGGADSAEMDELVQQRWQQLFSIRKSDLLSERTEEPATFTLGRVALAVLDILKMDNSARDLLVAAQDGSSSSFIEELKGAKKEVWRDSLAQMSRLYMLPVLLVLDGTLEEDEKAKSALDIVEVCRKGLESRIWIRTGADRGSWGFNVKNTQAIVTALMAFWRYVFEPGNYDRFQDAFRSASSTAPAAAP